MLTTCAPVATDALTVRARCKVDGLSGVADSAPLNTGAELHSDRFGAEWLCRLVLS